MFSPPNMLNFCLCITAVIMDFCNFCCKVTCFQTISQNFSILFFEPVLLIHKVYKKVCPWFTTRIKSTCEKLASAWFSLCGPARAWTWDLQIMSLRGYNSMKFSLLEIWLIHRYLVGLHHQTIRFKNNLTQPDCFHIVFAKILRKDIRLESGGVKLNTSSL